MGMDVFGRNPDSEAGHYFRDNIDDWRILWAYCVSVSPEAASLGEVGFHNDGEGFTQGGGAEGMGLQNMRYRARIIRGTFKIASAPQRGTVVTCILPIQQPRRRLSIS